MRKYSLKLIKEIIEKHKNGLVSAYIGMYEDWSPTAEKIWDNEEGYIIDREDGWGVRTTNKHDWQPDLESEDEIIAGGIKGSCWATPQIELNFKNGDSKAFDVFVDDGGKREMPIMMDSMLGYNAFRKRDE